MARTVKALSATWAYIGLLLTHLRMQAGIELEELARRMGCSPDEVARMEAGVTPLVQPWMDRADAAVGAGGLLSAAEDLVHPVPSRPERRSVASARARGGRLEAGWEAYDPATGRAGVLTAVYDAREVFADHGLPAVRIAFLRPPDGSREFWADADLLECPPGPLNPYECVLCGKEGGSDMLRVGLVGGDPGRGHLGSAHAFCARERDLGGLDLEEMADLIAEAQGRPYLDFDDPSGPVLAHRP